MLKTVYKVSEALVNKNIGGEFDITNRQNFVARLMSSKHKSAIAFKNALDDDLTPHWRL